MGARRGGESDTSRETTRSAEASEAKKRATSCAFCRARKNSRPGPKDRERGRARAGQPPAEPDHRSGKNVRSSPPSARKNVIVLSGAEDLSAQPTAGRPKAGRPEAARGAGDKRWQRAGRNRRRRELTVERSKRHQLSRSTRLHSRRAEGPAGMGGRMRCPLGGKGGRDDSRAWPSKVSRAGDHRSGCVRE